MVASGCVWSDVGLSASYALDTRQKWQGPIQNMANMEIKVINSSFTEQHLELSDVWTWQSDLHEDENILVPVPMTEEALQEAGSLLVSARFETASKVQLRGLVIYHLGADDVFAIDVLIGNQSFTLNKHFADLSQPELKRLATYLNQDVGSLLPIRYTLVPTELDIESGEFFW